jgi:hypothetical protein
MCYNICLYVLCVLLQVLKVTTTKDLQLSAAGMALLVMAGTTVLAYVKTQ